MPCLKEPTTGKSKPVLFKLPPELLADLAQAAPEQGVSQGSVVREAAAAHIAGPPGKKLR